MATPTREPDQQSRSYPASSGARARRKLTGRPFAIAAFVFAVLAILFFPPFLGALGVVLAGTGIVLGEKRLGLFALIASVVGAVIGVGLVIILYGG